MQGTAADIIKLAMIATDHWIESDSPTVKMIMQVHDELVLDIAPSELEQVKKITAPTLVITGDSDPMAPVENSRFLAEQIPDSTLVELPGVRHAFWVEKYEESSHIITGFFLNG